MNKTKYGENAKIPKSRLEEGVQSQGVIQGEVVVQLEEIVQDHSVVQGEVVVQGEEAV
jgi:hypothetical protein